MENSSEDKESKTLDPTEHAIQKALKEGRTPLSQELPNLGLMIALLLNIYIILPFFMPSASRTLASFLGPVQLTSLDGPTCGYLFKALVFKVAVPLFAFLGVMSFIIISFGLMQSYKAISSKSITPKFSNLSFKKGLSKIFSKRALVELTKTLIKATCLITIMIYVTQPIAWTHMIHWSLSHMKHAFSDWFMGIMIALLCSLVGVVGLDIIYQRWSHKKNLRMSPKDLKDEQKEMEGNPEIKHKRRHIAQNRKRMMAAVPEATVVIMNPTHFAVALSWNEEKMNAPCVIAKGRDDLALKIRDIARANKIPVMENPPLARALFDQVKIDHEIPSEHYQAVANIIKWVNELKSRKPI